MRILHRALSAGSNKVKSGYINSKVELTLTVDQSSL
mgnify:CR=1 FL=1